MHSQAFHSRDPAPLALRMDGEAAHAGPTSRDVRAGDDIVRKEVERMEAVG